MTYSEKLQDPRWQKKRLEIMQYADFRCQLCGDSTQTLHVHHSRYEAGKDPWDYPSGSLVCSCEKCHSVLHGKRITIEAIVFVLEEAVGMMREGAKAPNPMVDRVIAAAKRIEVLRNGGTPS